MSRSVLPAARTRRSAAVGKSFPHLHVASGYSLRYGASSPHDLVQRAAELELDALALTDRDGLYGAVKFVAAASQAGITPMLGVELAVQSSGLVAGLPGWADPSVAAAIAAAQGGPARGGVVIDARLPRVTVLAHGTAGAPELGGARVASGDSAVASAGGWSQLCRLVTATHARGERGVPVSTMGDIAAHALCPGGTTADPGRLTVLLGPASEVGRAVLAHREDLARAVLARWYDLLPLGSLAVEVVCHYGPAHTPGSLVHAARMLDLARQLGVPAVLSNAVRYARRDGAVTADVLDAVRRLVPLHERHLDRTTATGYLAGTEQMRSVAHAVAQAAGSGPDGAHDLLRDTEHVAQRCLLDPSIDLGIGSIHLPEPDLVTRGAAHTHDEANTVLQARCQAGIGDRYPAATTALLDQVQLRLAAELHAITTLGYATYFLTVAEVCDLIRDRGGRVAARGSGAGSLVNHLLGVSGIDPIAHGLLMERFCHPLRAELPDIDVDVESDRRTTIYQWILERFGTQRVSCVSMMDTYRIRHAVRDVGAALGLPPGEISAIASAFPHIRARDVRTALAELPELGSSGLAKNGRPVPRLELLFDLVERLDALPRHIALHPCGVLLSNSGLGGRTPTERSWEGFPMSQFDKDDVEVLGLLKLDVLGIRMQSAMAHTVAEVARVEQIPAPDIDAIPFDDEATYQLIRSAHTLGCFQIESPGQRELVGKFAPQEFGDLIIDISLFRPGPVKTDMVHPFLRARQGWTPPDHLHPSLRPALAETHGVVVFHEQVLKIFDIVTGCGLPRADELRRQMGSPDAHAEIQAWFAEAAALRGYAPADITRIWGVLKGFASFGFCKAHAAAFALPTYQSAWLKAHHPAAFFAGVLTHDPGMYPKRLILDDARNLGITVLGLDVNASAAVYQVEKVPTSYALPPSHALPYDTPPTGDASHGWGTDWPDRHGLRFDARLPDGRGYGIRIALADVKGISDAEIDRIIASRPYHSLADLWHRARPSRPIAERLILAGGLDTTYGIGAYTPVRSRHRITRRDLLLQVVDLDRWSKANRSSSDQQLPLDLGDAPERATPSGLPELSAPERIAAELEILGLDASGHVIDYYRPMLADLRTTQSRTVLGCRNGQEILVAGVKVATQTPPVRSGRRVVFLTLDDSTGPVDATFFDDAQGPYALTVFNSWLMLVRGQVRRTGPRGVSLRATGAWELGAVWHLWCAGGADAVADLLTEQDESSQHRMNAALDPPTRTLGTGRDDGALGEVVDPDAAVEANRAAAARTRRRVLIHASGYRQSPYADIRPQGEDVRTSRKLWHASPGSSGR